MKIPTFILTSLFMVISITAKAENLNPDQIAVIIEKLEKMEKGIEDDKNGVIRNAVSAFREGVASDRAAVELYLNCYRELNFTRNEARVTEWQDWKNRNKDRHADDNFQAALRLQLQYLVLTLRAAEEGEPEERAKLIRDLQSFLAVAVPKATGIAEDLAAEREIGARDTDENRIRRAIRDARGEGGGVDLMRMLRGNVLQSVFAQAYELDRSLADLENWEMSPLGLSGHYSKAILPYYGTVGVSEMGKAWDQWIEYEVRFAKASKSLADYTEFMARNVPEMRWKKAVYFYQVGYQVEGASKMLDLIAENRGHPLLPDWYAEFKGLLTKNVAPPAEEEEASE